MRITTIQYDIVWEDKVTNLKNLTSKINTIQSDVIVLPEMFTTGFTMTPNHLAESMTGKTIQWMKEIALTKDLAICGSIIIREEDKYFNRFIWVNPDGTIYHYDKRHLFLNEDVSYTPGDKKLIIEYKGWKICPLICYDLRFPAWSRNVNWSKTFEQTHQYDVLIYVANWPERRSHAWKSLLVARAIENQCYVIGVNRIGLDGNDINYTGDSMVISPLGEIISKTKANEESVETITLNIKELNDYRAAFPAINDADEFEIHI
jgi:predicted amidohydrolase